MRRAKYRTKEKMFPRENIHLKWRALGRSSMCQARMGSVVPHEEKGFSKVSHLQWGGYNLGVAPCEGRGRNLLARHPVLTRKLQCLLQMTKLFSLKDLFDWKIRKEGSCHRTLMGCQGTFCTRRPHWTILRVAWMRCADSQMTELWQGIITCGLNGNTVSRASSFATSVTNHSNLLGAWMKSESNFLWSLCSKRRSGLHVMMIGSGHVIVHLKVWIQLCKLVFPSPPGIIPGVRQRLSSHVYLKPNSEFERFHFHVAWINCHQQDVSEFQHFTADFFS